MNLKSNPTSKYRRIKVGITMGDPCGIGPIIILKALNRLKGLADFVVLGDEWVFSKIKNQRVKIKNFRFVDLHNVAHKNFAFGKVKAEYGRAAIEYLDKALELIKNNEIDCLVTSPVSKEAVNLAKIKFSGQTEYLSGETQTKNFAMMLLNKQLRIVLVTRHIPIKDVSGELKPDKLYKTILITHRALRKMFLIKHPRLVVCGLNPHASDNGLTGNEENKVIKPVIKKIRNKMSVDGPFSADVAIYKASQKKYDCAIAMYHDQALIPLKITDVHYGVNMTLGLPFVRTSPLHGTAFDIARDPRLVNPSSLIEAIKLAVQCTLNLKKD